MELNKESSSNQILEALKQEHKFQYNLINQNIPISISHKSSGFEVYIFLTQEGNTLISLKCQGKGEDLIILKQKIKDLLLSLDYQITEES